MLIMVAGVTVFAEGLAGNVQKAEPQLAFWQGSPSKRAASGQGFGMGSKKITPVEAVPGMLCLLRDGQVCRASQEVNTTFEDVKGCDEVKAWISEDAGR